jgi:hypothetical protein
MDPRDIRRQYDEIKADKAQQQASEKSKTDQERLQRQKVNGDARTALRDVVIPYLQEVVDEFPAKEFHFRPAIGLQDKLPVGVSFGFQAGPTYHIQATGLLVQISKVSGQGASMRRTPLPPEVAPHIGTATDLTRDKVEKLVEMAVADLRA